MNEVSGQWTKRLIPDVSKWQVRRCQNRRLDYFSTQALTDYGLFKSYTRRIGKDTDDEYVYCGEENSAEYTRRKLGMVIMVNNIADVNTKGVDRFGMVQEVLHDMMKVKKMRERVKQARELEEGPREEGWAAEGG